MFKIGLIILALIAMVGTTTHYAFANNMGGPAMGPADTGGGGGGGSMGSSDTTTSPSGSAEPSDNSQSNTATESPPPHVDFPAGWLAGHEKYGGPAGYGL